jgi:TPR repeat protein
VVGNKPTSINTISALRIKSFITTFLIIYPNPNLGFMYKKGKGVKQDDFKAFKFFQKACDLNSGSGCFNLGLSYKEGKLKQPLPEFKSHAFWENLNALKSSCLTPLPSLYCFNLGFMYKKGKGVKQDDFKALKFYLKGVWFEFWRWLLFSWIYV